MQRFYVIILSWLLQWTIQINQTKTQAMNNTYGKHVKTSTTDIWRCGDCLQEYVKICSLPSHALPWSGSNGSVSTLARLPEYPWQEISNRTYYVASRFERWSLNPGPKAPEYPRQNCENMQPSLRTHYRDQVQTVLSQPWSKTRVPAAAWRVAVEIQPTRKIPFS
jgi:hypothetical protein